MNPLHALTGKPLAMRPESVPGLAALANGPEASRFVGTRADGETTRTIGSTAILSIIGPLFSRGAAFSEFFGAATYETLAAKLDAVAYDPKITSIVLDIDSPGGEAIGCFELAAQIRSISARKPVVAFVNGMACSAAYALASAARSIVAAPSAIVGSIGVVAMHLDFSRALDAAGVTPTLIFAGANKVDGSPYQPLADGARGAIQAEVDGLNDMFLDTVAAGRGARLTRKAAKATEARTYIGADAKAAGLIDHLGAINIALALARPTASTKGPLAAAKPSATAGAVAKSATPEGAKTIDSAAIYARRAAQGRTITTPQILDEPPAPPHCFDEIADAIYTRRSAGPAQRKSLPSAPAASASPATIDAASIYARRNTRSD